MLGHYLGGGTSQTIGYYPLQSNANDSSGNGYNMTTTTNTTYSATTGRFGAGAICGATSVMYLTSATPAIQPTATFSCWVYITAYPTSGNYFAFFSQANNSGPNYFLEFRIGTSGYLMIYNSSSTIISYTSTKALIPLSKWTHIACTYILGTSCSFYMNGAFEDSPTGSGTYTTIGTLTHSICLGCSYSYSSPQDDLVGNMCESIFENTQWSAIKIQKYYTGCLGRFISK